MGDGEDEWRRLVALGRAVLPGVTQPGAVVVERPVPADAGERSIGYRVVPGANPLPFLVDLEGVPPGAYFFTVGRRSVPVVVPAADR